METITAAETALIEAIRTFAVATGRAQLAHMCTAALTGEAWASERLLNRLAHNLDLIDTDRPDGLVPRQLLSI